MRNPKIGQRLKADLDSLTLNIDFCLINMYKRIF
jgi:hypothetical protein